jgi:regulation of enolase protein 1 (concanavalin A-like superfamily)
LSALAIAVVTSVAALAAPAAASDQVYFSKNTNVTDILVGYINQETVRVDISSWYLSEHSISIAVANRFAAGVPVRIIGDRGAIFEADPNTKREYYWLASQGVPIRLRFNPTWFPEINHWKAAIFVGQNVVEFGSGNFAPTELAPISPSNYDDESEMFTSDPDIVNAFKTKFDRMWNDTTVEPQSIIGGPPYLKDWDDACTNEPTGNCADYHTLYPNPTRMLINTARLEPDYPIPPDLIFAQGAEMNNRMIQEINAETVKIDLVAYRLEIGNLTQALLDKFNAGVPVRLIVDKNQYTNIIWPEYWLTHAYIDKLWAAGVPIVQNNHLGVTHEKTLITSNYATNGSSNWGPNWQRDHNYFVPKATKLAIYQAFVDNFNEMWNDHTNYGPLVTTPPRAVDLTMAGTVPSAGQTSVPTTPTFTWNRAAWATSYDIYLGTNSGNMTLVANVPASLEVNPPNTYSWTPQTPLAGGTTYVWKIVSRTFANMTATSDTESFATTGGASALPSPWQNQDVGVTGQAGSSSFSNGTFTVRGAGANIWGSSDGFQFAYQTLTGDGSIVARVVGVQNTSSFAKAGIMLRTSVAAGSQHVVLDLRPTGDIEFMTRSTNGGSTSWLAGAVHAAPVWLKLTRSGTTVTGSMSADGSTWTTIGSTTIAFPSAIDAGMIVTSQDTSTINTSTFDSAVVSSSSGSAPATPSSPSPANAATGVSTTPTLSWSSSGATSYDVAFGTTNPPPPVSTGQAASTYTPPALSTSTTYFWKITAHNASGVTSGPVWSFTTAAAPTPPATPANPSPANGASGVATSATLTWTSSGATSYDVKFGTSNPPTQVSTGQAGASYTPPALTSGTTYFWQIVAHNSVGATTGPVWSFSTAASGLPSPWQNQDVGSTGQAGSSTFNAGTFTVRGAGANIWGTSDGFQFAYQTLTGNGQIVARVASIQNTNSFAKAGIMLRASVAANSQHVILDLRPTGDIEFMTRSANGGSTSWLSGAVQAAPVWLKLSISGSTVTGSVSTDGSTWTQVGSTTIAFPSTILAGLIVSSVDTSTLNTSTFDSVAVSTTGTPPGAPASPSPANAATGVSTSPTLAWTAANATSYDVKFGTTNPPPTVSTSQAAASYSTSTLGNSTTYFWQIVAKNGSGSTAGPVWSFTTTAVPPPPPGTPANPSPSNSATGVATSPTLTWSATNATSYDVKFGTTNTPPVVSVGQSTASYTPSTLNNSTTYFWQIVARNGSGSTSGPLWSFTTAASTSPTNIVIYAADIPAGNFQGQWTTGGDATAAAATAAVTPDSGFANTSAPLASPTHYVDVTFSANAGVAYTFWMRVKAAGNSKLNDSLFVQFSDALVGTTAMYQMNTTNGLVVNLATDTNASSLSNWGWVNGAYWLSQPATLTFASSGTHTIRIQTREDGVQFDQIVLSPSQYFNNGASCPITCTGAPGPVNNDSTIVPKP